MGLLWGSILPVEGATPPTPAGPDEEVTRVVVLGVTHSGQLVSRASQPAVLRAFFDRVSPVAIGIERDPEAFARGDHYEFTYEIQEVAVPYARERGLPLYPFDWVPPVEDQHLAFGLDLSALPLLRPASGFQGFVSFPDSADLTRPLFFAEDATSAEMEELRRWQTTPAEPPHADFPRRLFLYRTFLQARRIWHMAQAHPGETVLVVVGAFHKEDIEAILAGYPRIEIVSPSAFGEPTEDEVRAHLRTEDLHAIAYFNLLGVQAASGMVDWDWMAEVVDELERRNPTPEARLLAVRLAELTGRIDGEAAAEAYEALRSTTSPELRFTWNGVLDPGRLDSFFDPFANLAVRDRAALELARVLTAGGPGNDAAAIRSELGGSLTPLQQRQLEGHWETYVIGDDVPAVGSGAGPPDGDMRR